MIFTGDIMQPVEFSVVYASARERVVQGDLGIMGYSLQLQEKFRGLRAGDGGQCLGPQLGG